MTTESSTPQSSGKQWFVVHVLSGQEKRVIERIQRKVEVEEMGHVIYDVLSPTETIAEIKKGKKIETKKKFFPGYVLINMDLYKEDGSMNNEAWYFILGVDGVIGFAGTKNKPSPMKQKEVDILLAQIREIEESVRPRFTFEVGDFVRVTDGAFEGQSGTIEEIDSDLGKLRVGIEIFGRSTPVDLEYWQVERAE